MFIHARAPRLDSIGRVIDFSKIKEIAGQWIDENWDHTTILYEKDLITIEALDGIPKKKPLFILSKNPTAENMAEVFLKEICPFIFDGYGIEIFKIVLWETENCYVEVEL
jgi:6-pyruvoyltetrahydropterin/6-carboxytetrahydropterin synthase